jgi:hypothetical protein
MVTRVEEKAVTSAVCLVAAVVSCKPSNATF